MEKSKMNKIERVLVAGVLSGALVMGAGAVTNKKDVTIFGFGWGLSSLASMILSSEPDEKKKKYSPFEQRTEDYLEDSIRPMKKYTGDKK